MKQPRRSYGLDIFKIKSQSFDLKLLSHSININKKKYIKKYLYEEYVYNVCDDVVNKYLLTVRYKNIDTRCTCFLKNIKTNEEITFTANQSSYSVMLSIKALINTIEDDKRNAILNRILRIKAYESS
mgnify:CR=1 FL=1|tara:strand:+ start:1063 stop:1443 length:381 start_codon:yes stop_codon:yes gene_type:complete